MQRWQWWATGAVIAGALTAGVLTGRAGPAMTAATGAEERVIWLAAVEYKGGADAAQEPFPTDVQPPGPGIKLEKQDGRWETEAYRWDPGVVVAYTGEKVRLRFWGVNGKEHPAYIEKFAPGFTVRRGRMTEVAFTAGAPGLYRIVCRVHQPSMVAYALVLERP